MRFLFAYLQNKVLPLRRKLSKIKTKIEYFFSDLFHPKHRIVVGGAGISLEQFLLLSPENLF